MYSYRLYLHRLTDVRVHSIEQRCDNWIYVAWKETLSEVCDDGMVGMWEERLSGAIPKTPWSK